MENTSIQIRAYTPTDKEQVLNILRLNTPQYFAPEEEAEFSHYLDHEIEFYFVLEQGNNLLGCGGVNTKNNGRTGVISWGMIHPNYHKQQLGKQLLLHRIKKLESLPRVEEITVRTSQLVYGFFLKQGFELVEVQKNYWAEGLHLYSMKKTQ